MGYISLRKIKVIWQIEIEDGPQHFTKKWCCVWCPMPLRVGQQKGLFQFLWHGLPRRRPPWCAATGGVLSGNFLGKMLVTCLAFHPRRFWFSGFYPRTQDSILANKGLGSDSWSPNELDWFYDNVCPYESLLKSHVGNSPPACTHLKIDLDAFLDLFLCWFCAMVDQFQVWIFRE